MNHGKTRTTTILALLPALAALAVPPVFADVLVLDNGREMKGMIDKQQSDSRFIRFVGARAAQKIARDRIKEIREEPPAAGHTHIGDEFREMGKVKEALDSYRQALRLDPNFALAKTRISEVEKNLAAEQMSKRQGQIDEISKLADEIRAFARGGEFDKAEELLGKSSDLLPTEEQKATLRKVAGELYLAWARERMDKFDRPGAEEKLNVAYAADQDNQQVIEMLLSVWEGQSDKQDQIITIYENLLEKQPDDATRRRKLADLYLKRNDLVNAARHYMDLYKSSPKYKGTELELTLLDVLDQLHRKFASEKSYDDAIAFYKLAQAIDPRMDDRGLIYYQYLQKANSVAKGDSAGWLAVAEFAEKNDMQSEALQTYRLVLERESGNAKALAALDRYAVALVNEAQQSFERQDYFLAKALSDRVRTDFPESKEAVQRAADVIQASNTEIQRMGREKEQLCKAYVERGDSYYQQAMVFYRDFFDTTRSSTNTRVSSPKGDATRYFRYAISMYERALQECPQLANDPTGLVTANLAEAKRYLSRLDAPLPSRQNFGRPGIGPSYTDMDR